MKHWMVCLLLLASTLWVGAKEPLYTDAKNGFQLTPPPGWESRPELAAQNGAVAAFVGPFQQKMFHANINVMVQPMGDLKAFTKLTVAQIKSAQGSVVSQKVIKLGTWPACQLVWKATMKGSPLQFNSTYVCTGGKTYLFTGTSLQSSWPQVSDQIEKSADSLRLLP